MPAYPPIVTIEMYNTLVTAIMSGAREVYYGDKRVVYRTLGEMMQIKDMAARELGIQGAQDGRKFASFNKGLHDDC